MIKSVEVTGLPGQTAPLVVTLNPDLNVLTGRNGSGKTNFLKLVWYIISGNIAQAVQEVPFEQITVETGEYKIRVTRQPGNELEIEFTDKDGKRLSMQDHEDEDYHYSAAEHANSIVQQIGNSIFFPTFRRIEGGFSIGRRAMPRLSPPRPNRSDIEEALLNLSRRLSNGDHVFVTSISTVDIQGLLQRSYADLSDYATRLQQQVSQDIISRIMSYKRMSGEIRASSAEELIDEIRTINEDLEQKRLEIFAPYEAVRELAARLFRHEGINLGSRISFSDAANAINSELLSAGEKQMLSFIAYNAFSNNCVIFIDEPELSLHVDWQRQLFPILSKQNLTNQFIVATHSPFIYTKYKDKEIALSTDRGDLDEDVD